MWLVDRPHVVALVVGVALAAALDTMLWFLGARHILPIP